MADFCPTSTEVITFANYNNAFTGTSCLPNGTGFTSIDTTTGLITSSVLTAHINQLLSRQDANAPETIIQLREMNPAEEFATKSAKLRKNMQDEYCFYYRRYIFILEKILYQAATETSSQLSSSDYTTRKNNTISLNSKLNQILQVIQALVNSRSATLKTYYGTTSGVNQVNTALDTRRIELLNHSTLLKEKVMEKDLKSAMVDYTVEKNSSSRNLLAIYGFMNIVAAGMIFYLYRSSKSQ